MDTAGDQLRTLAPALGFLLAGVPLAALLDRLGFFEAVVARLAEHRRSVPVGALWVLAGATTIVLNLDTTVVLLTPLYLRLARRAQVDPVALALVPVLLASLASSVLPVSNLTTLITAQQLHLGVGQVLSHLAAPSLVASGVGWLVYRRRHPTTVACPSGAPADPPSLHVGATVVGGGAGGLHPGRGRRGPGLGGGRWSPIWS